MSPGGEQAGQRLGFGCLALFGLPFLAAGLFVIGLFGRAFLEYRRAGAWERVPARIEAAELESHRGSKGGYTYSVKASYSYEYGGRAWTGTRVAPDVGASSDSRHRERWELLRRHQQSGRPFPAWVNPASPGESLLFRELAPMSWLLLPFGMVFALVGAGMIWAAAGQLVGGRRRARRLAADPGRPWRADPRWVRGFVFDARAGSKAAGGWGCAAFLAVFVGLFAYLAFTQGAPLFAKAIMGLFVLVAVAAAGLAAYWTAQYFKYGSPKLALAEMPAVPGRTLTAIVLCRRHVDVAGAFKATLKCARTTGGGKSSHTETLHERTVEVTLDLAGGGRGGTAIPVEMPVPADLPGSTAPEESPAVKWTLAVKAATAGVDFAAEFDLPVFAVENESLIERRAPEGGGP